MTPMEDFLQTLMLVLLLFWGTVAIVAIFTPRKRVEEREEREGFDRYDRV